MGTLAQPPSPAPLRGFRHSLDWRFLLPLSDLAGGCLVFEDDASFTQALEQAGMRTLQRLSVSDDQKRSGGRFPFVALPFGVPGSWVRARAAGRAEFYSTLRDFIERDGYLLVGFKNSLSWHSHAGEKYLPSTPRHMRRALTHAGYQSVEIFGAMPDLQIPEYIFELTPHTLRFALQNRFRRKPAVLRAMRLLSRTVGLRRVSHFLPCYFAVAVA